MPIDATADLSTYDLFDEVCADDVHAAIAGYRPSVQPSTLQQFVAYEASSHS